MIDLVIAAVLSFVVVAGIALVSTGEHYRCLKIETHKK